MHSTFPILGSRGLRSPGTESPNLQPRKRQSKIHENHNPNALRTLNAQTDPDHGSPVFVANRLDFILENSLPEQPPSGAQNPPHLEASLHTEQDGCAINTLSLHATTLTDQPMTPPQANQDATSANKGRFTTSSNTTPTRDFDRSQKDVSRSADEGRLISTPGGQSASAERTPGSAPRSTEESPQPVLSQYRLTQFMNPSSPFVGSPHQLTQASSPSHAVSRISSHALDHSLDENSSRPGAAEGSGAQDDSDARSQNPGPKEGQPWPNQSGSDEDMLDSLPSQAAVTLFASAEYTALDGFDEVEAMNASRWLTSWSMPVTVCEAYSHAGVVELYTWQVECIESTRVLENRANLVYSAPTSAGKTLVAEVLEKVEYFRKILHEEAVNVQGYCSGNLGTSTPSSDPELSVCTIEKANGIVNRLLQENRLEEIGAVVIDEVHMLADPSRGYLLEILLSKLLFRAHDALQIIALSATVPNIKDLAKWLRAQLYVTDFRPVPLTEFLVVNRQVCDPQGHPVRPLQPSPAPSDPDGIVQLSLEALQQGFSVLVFCATKRACQQCALLLASSMSSWTLPSPLELCHRRSHLLHKLAETPTGLDPVLAKTVPRGVAFHHAGLTVEERHCLEAAFDQGVLAVLTATSTLAAGVNLPAHRVIFRSPYVGSCLLDEGRYRQMSGRAGRAGKDLSGESYVMCEARDKAAVAKVMASTLRPVLSCLCSDAPAQSEGLRPRSGSAVGTRRAVLEGVDNGIASTEVTLASFLGHTFYCSLRGELHIAAAVRDAIDWLTAAQMVRRSDDGVVSTSHLGKAVVASSLAPHEALAVFHDLKIARDSMALDDELHLIYLNTPVMSFDIPWRRFFDLFQQLRPSCRRIAEMLGVKEPFLLKARTRKPDRDRPQPNADLALENDRDVDIHTRFFAAMIIRELVMEYSLQHVASKFQVPRGVVQQLQTQSVAFAGMVSTFCGKLQWWQLESLCARFQERLSQGVTAELVPLMAVPTMRSVWARALIAAGLSGVAALARADASHVAEILRAAMPFVSDAQGWELAQAHKMVKAAASQVAKSAVDEDLLAAANVGSGRSGTWYHTARTMEEVDDAANELQAAATVGLHCHTSERDGHGGEMLGVAVSIEGGRTWYMQLRETDVGRAAKAAVRAMAGDGTTTKVVCDVKRQANALRRLGIDLAEPLHDPLLASWLLPSRRHCLLSSEELARGRALAIPRSDCAAGSEESSCVEATCAVRVWPHALQELQQHGLEQYYTTVELPTAMALGRMEACGVGVSGSQLAHVEQQIRSAQKAIDNQVESLAGRRVDLGSSASIVGFLYDTLNIPLPVSVTSTGWKARNLPRLCAPAVLKQLAKQHPAAALILHHRKLSFLLTSAVRPLANARRRAPTAEEIARVFPRQQLLVCETGRIAVKGPNVQCLPKPFGKFHPGHQLDSALESRSQSKKRDESDSIVIRNCIVAKEGCVLLCGDYKQIELRIIAHLSKDPALRRALANCDVFREMAAEWGGVDSSAVTDAARDQAKRLCYGLMYGMGVSTLAEELGVDVVEAEGLVKTFRRAYAGVDALIKRSIQAAQTDGFVQTLMGRKRWLPDLVSPNASKRSAAERQAFNSVVQGSAADVLRLALIAVTSDLAPSAGAVVMQVHDELMLEVDAQRLPEVARMLKHHMEGAVELEVTPLMRPAAALNAGAGLPPTRSRASQGDGGGAQVPLEVKLQWGPSWGRLREFTPEPQ